VRDRNKRRKIARVNVQFRQARHAAWLVRELVRAGSPWLAGLVTVGWFRVDRAGERWKRVLAREVVKKGLSRAV